jgi:hypothetical protein
VDHHGGRYPPAGIRGRMVDRFATPPPPLPASRELPWTSQQPERVENTAGGEAYFSARDSRFFLVLSSPLTRVDLEVVRLLLGACSRSRQRPAVM